MTHETSSQMNRASIDHLRAFTESIRKTQETGKEAEIGLKSQQMEAFEKSLADEASFPTPLYFTRNERSLQKKNSKQKKQNRRKNPCLSAKKTRMA